MSFKSKSSSIMSTSEALKLIEELQKFVVQKNEIIESLEEQVRMLTAERDDLKKEVQILTAEKSELILTDSSKARELVAPMSDLGSLTLSVKPVDSDGNNTTSESINSTGSDSGVCMSNREVASHGETTSYDIVYEKRVVDEGSNITNLPTITTPKKIIINRSTGRLPHRSNSARMYELSVDLREKTIECLENKYGGKEAANEAARKIQQSYRHWVISKSFQRMRACSGRKRSLTMPEKHFEKLKKTSLVFYGPDNPVMIIDGEPLKVPTEKVRHKSESDLATTEAVPSIADLVSDPSLRLDSHSTDSEDSVENDPDTINSGFVNDHFQGNVDAEEKDQIDSGGINNSQADEKTPVKRSASRTSSSSSSQYDIIEDSNVLTVEEKHVDLGDGSSMCVDRIHSHDTTDGLCFSSERRYEAADREAQKRQFRIGVNLFNWKPEVGIQYLIDNELLEADVPKIAEFLRTHTSISKQKISEYFGNLRNDFNNRVLLEFAKSFDFVGKEVDEALRQFQSYFKLTGEAQTVEKFLQVFSERYVECNPGQISDNPDTILLLAFALAMLNTDLHNQNVKRRMTVEEFLKNLRGTDNGNDLDQDMLRGMYSRIQKNEFATGADHMTQLYQIENSFIGKVPNLAATHRQFVKLFTVEEVYDPTKKEKPHNRLAFLFNDLLLLAKPRGKSGAHGSSGHTFSCKASFSLLNKRVAEFKNENYNFGVLLIGKLDNKAIVKLNLKDEKTKKGFVDELDEYIRETNGLENIRIALTKAKQLSWHNRRKDDGRTKSLLISDDTQIGAMDKAETTSLMDLRVDDADVSRNRMTRGDRDGGKIINSASMGDINESDVDLNNDESEYEKIVRTNSNCSLDSKLSANSKDDSHLYQQQASTMPVRSSTVKKPHHMFGNWGPKLKKSPSSASHRATSPSFLRKRDKSPSQMSTREKSSTFIDGSAKSTTMSKREKRKSLTGSIS